MRAKIGVSNGVYWTPEKSDVFQIKTTIRKGTGKLRVSGYVGSDFVATVENVIEIIESIYKITHDKALDMSEFNIKVNSLDVMDGTSAGLPLFVSIYSALKRFPVFQHIVYTGYIDKEGNILSVDKIKEKITAIMQHKISGIVIPRNNMNDLPNVMERITYCITHVDDIFIHPALFFKIP